MIADPSSLSPLAHLLSAARSGPRRPEPSSCKEYDWSRPCCFSPAQVEQVGQFAASAAGQLGQQLGRMTRQELSFQAATELCYFSSLAQGDAGHHYAATLLDESSQPAGLIVLPTATALGYIARLLGGKPTATQERELSVLESELLLDLLGAMSEAFGSALPNGRSLKRGGEIVRLSAVAPQTFCDCCRIGLGDGTTEAFSVVLSCRFVESVLGLSGPPRSADETRKLLLSHLDRACITGEVWLPSAVLRFQDALAMEGGDVLLLSGGAGDPVRLVVQGKPMAMGRIAQCQGHYALTITSKIK